MPAGDSSEEVGAEAPVWIRALLQEYLGETYDVGYPLPVCRRLLKEVRLSYRKPRRSATKADEYEQEDALRYYKKAAGDGRYRSLHWTDEENRTSWAACRVVFARRPALG